MEKIYFSPGNECVDGIIEALKEARKTIDICVFTISDNRIVNVLKQKKSFYVDIRIITDNDKRFDAGSDIEELAKQGIPVRVDRTDAHMHHKFAIVDCKVLITGSYNWTRSARERNYENIVISDSKEMVSEFKEEFKRLWKIMKPLN